jgi:ligand-binding sensor domain-containing protein
MRSPPDGWDGRPVQAITQGRDGTVWAATEGAGLYRMQTNSWQNFRGDAGLSNPYVWSVLEDSRGQVWAGTWGGGLYQLQGTNFVSKFDLAERGEPVTALKQFPDGTIWIGTAAGLIRCKDDQLERFSSLGGAAAGDVRVLAEGREGELWFGTQGSGLGCLKNGQLRTFHPADGLPSDFILSLLQEADGTWWIGTLDKGVCLFENGKFHALSTEQGLPNNCIGLIQDDGLGNLWFSSQKGLFRVNRSDLFECAMNRRPRVNALVFGKAEGLTTLAGSSGFTPAGFRSADGRLWFPTARGIAVVNPKSVRRNTVRPPVWIEEILVDGQPARTRAPANTNGANGAGDLPVKDVQVKPGHRQLDVRFTALSFTSPERVQFK